MRKYTKSYVANDEKCLEWLIKLDELVQSDTFLSGLGVNPPPISSDLGYKVVDDLSDADELWVSQEMWSMPRP